MGTGEVEVKVGLPLGRQPGDIHARHRLEGIAGVPEVGGDAHGVDLDVRGAELGVEVIAVDANSACDGSCHIDVFAGLRAVVLSGGDDGENELGGAEKRQLLEWAAGVAYAVGQRADGGGCHVLGKIEALQPKKGMGHAEHPSDDLQGLAGILAGPDGAVRGYPGSFRVVDLGESGGGGLVSDRQ